MRRIHVYYRDDFGYTAAALTKYDDDGDYYDADEVDAEMARLRAALAEAERENEDLRADLVWSVGDVGAGFNPLECWVAYYENDEVKTVDCDGTDADLCRAIREARRGE